MLEWVKTLEAAGMRRMYFACKKDMHFGGQRMEYYGLNFVSRNSYVKALIPSMTVFGDRTFKEATDLGQISLSSLVFSSVKQDTISTCPRRLWG